VLAAGCVWPAATVTAELPAATTAALASLTRTVTVTSVESALPFCMSVWILALAIRQTRTAVSTACGSRKPSAYARS
jgi:hypothetical protein